jgi:hypothetical protein
MVTNYIDSLSEFRAWIVLKISEFVGTGLRAEECLIEVLGDTRAHIQLYCPDKLDMIPDLNEQRDMTDEQLRALRTLVIDKLQALRDAISSDQQSQNDDQGLRTKVLSKQEIAHYFGVNRNKVSEMLKQYDTVLVGSRIRLLVKDMPPLYFTENRIDLPFPR